MVNVIVPPVVVLESTVTVNGCDALAASYILPSLDATLIPFVDVTERVPAPPQLVIVIVPGLPGDTLSVCVSDFIHGGLGGGATVAGAFTTSVTLTVAVLVPAVNVTCPVYVLAVRLAKFTVRVVLDVLPLPSIEPLLGFTLSQSASDAAVQLPASHPFVSVTGWLSLPPVARLLIAVIGSEIIVLADGMGICSVKSIRPRGARQGESGAMFRLTFTVAVPFADVNVIVPEWFPSFKPLRETLILTSVEPLASIEPLSGVSMIQKESVVADQLPFPHGLSSVNVLEPGRLPCLAVNESVSVRVCTQVGLGADEMCNVTFTVVFCDPMLNVTTPV